MEHTSWPTRKVGGRVLARQRKRHETLARLDRLVSVRAGVSLGNLQGARTRARSHLHGSGGDHGTVHLRAPAGVGRRHDWPRRLPASGAPPPRYEPGRTLREPETAPGEHSLGRALTRRTPPRRPRKPSNPTPHPKRAAHKLLSTAGRLFTFRTQIPLILLSWGEPPLPKGRGFSGTLVEGPELHAGVPPELPG